MSNVASKKVVDNTSGSGVYNASEKRYQVLWSIFFIIVSIIIFARSQPRRRGRGKNTKAIRPVSKIHQACTRKRFPPLRSCQNATIKMYQKNVQNI